MPFALLARVNSSLITNAGVATAAAAAAAAATVYTALRAEEY
jgi:hypothetical protein